MPASASNKRVRSRLLAGALALAGLFGLGASCTSVLGLDGQQDASAVLCSKLDLCYASGGPVDCKTRVADRLGAAPGDMQSGWLQSFSSDTCLADCASARRCLDLQPVCAAHNARCSATEDCCDFIAGTSDCVAGFCCSTQGVRCNTDDDCCSNAGYCEPDPQSLDGGKSCGARVCSPATMACRLDPECCSGVCTSGHCGSTICNPNGFDCTADTDCCSKNCDVQQGATTGTCDSTCAATGLVCTQDTDCCNGAVCFTPWGASSGYCSLCATGGSLGVHCTVDTDCCPTEPSADGGPGVALHCDQNFFLCSPTCQPLDGGCASDTDCCNGSCSNGTCNGAACSDTFCTKDSDCCTGTCLGSTCKPACAAVPDCHALCLEGGPLGAACFDGGGTCVTDVCARDAYCCCTAWDTLCISEAAMTSSCAEVCP